MYSVAPPKSLEAVGMIALSMLGGPEMAVLRFIGLLVVARFACVAERFLAGSMDPVCEKKRGKESRDNGLPNIPGTGQVQRVRTRLTLTTTSRPMPVRRNT